MQALDHREWQDHPDDQAANCPQGLGNEGSKGRHESRCACPVDDHLDAIPHPGEKILNSPLTDLYVNSGKAMSEIYEVKTSLARQSIYTGIGQLLVHSAGEAGDVRRVLVLPDGKILHDLALCIRKQKLGLRRFKLIGSGRNRKAVLL